MNRATICIGGDGRRDRKGIRPNPRIGHRDSMLVNADESGEEESFQRSLRLLRKNSLEIDDHFKTC